MTTNETHSDNNEGGGRNWLPLFAGLAALGVLTVLFIGGFGADRELAEENQVLVVDDAPAPVELPLSGPPLAVGDRPYNFTLRDTTGSEVSLNELVGRPVIINYWATWCGPCRIEMPHLQSTFEARQEEGLALLALNQDETVAEIEAYFDELGLTFTALLDEGNRTSQNYGVGRILPTTFFINPEGEITAIHRGPMTQEQIDGYLAGNG